MGMELKPPTHVASKWPFLLAICSSLEVANRPYRVAELLQNRW